MNMFSYRGGELYVEDISVARLMEQYGTPAYIYSKQHLVGQYRDLVSAMKDVAPLICYSVKANSNKAILQTFISEGSGMDVVSGGELFRALRAGADPSKIVFAGVGKTTDEIEYALNQKILFFTVESEQEVERISKCAVKLGATARVAFRVTPGVDPKTHKYITTGKKENKFGLDINRTLVAYELAAGLPNIEIIGVHMHIGSQILTVSPFVEALEKVKEICLKLKTLYPTLKYIDIGGGIGIKYRQEENPLAPVEFARHVVPVLKSIGLKVIMEPGRYLVGNAGLLVCAVQYVKDNPLKTFVVVNAGMNDLIRPSLYDGHHQVIAIKETKATIQGDVVGPICESGDFLAQERAIPAVKQGDLLGICSAGAYGYAMASNYNSRPRPVELMVNGDKAVVICRRETLEDLVRNENV